jgi:hypothetical protein
MSRLIRTLTGLSSAQPGRTTQNSASQRFSVQKSRSDEDVVTRSKKQEEVTFEKQRKARTYRLYPNSVRTRAAKSGSSSQDWGSRAESTNTIIIQNRKSSGTRARHVRNITIERRKYRMKSTKEVSRIVSRVLGARSESRGSLGALI